MDLECLKTRRVELEQARTNVANSWQTLTGHIAECDYQISLLEANHETLVDAPVDPEDTLPVE